MRFAKHLPFVILSLMLGSAAGVLVLGARFAQEEREVVVEHDQAPLTGFTSRLLGEIGDLESLYEQRLLDVRDRIEAASSTVEMAAIGRNIVGLEQITIFGRDDEPIQLDLRQEDRSEPLPVPRALGRASGRGQGIIVDVGAIQRDVLGADFHWIEAPGHLPHFAARLVNGEVIVLRVNPEDAAASMNGWLVEWLPPAFAPVEASGLAAELRSPSGHAIAAAGAVEPGADPSLLLPVTSRFGDWSVASWTETKTIVSYRQPVLMGSAALAVILAVVGVFAFVQQRRALRLAEQRVSFANRVSHELRTPLTNILLNIDLVADSVPDNDAGADRLELIRDEAGRLSRLLDNVLTFSKRDAAEKPLHLASCDVKQAIDDVLEQFGPALRRRNIAVTRSQPESDVVAVADADALRQILGNLVSNVEKYAADGGKLEIGVMTDREGEDGGEKVVLSVTDHGPGISMSKAERIFQPFVRLNESTSEGASGTGLGLAIARNLAENMHGSLVLKSPSPEGRGARFDLVLPRASAKIIAMAS